MRRLARALGHVLFGGLGGLALLFCSLVTWGVFSRVDKPFLGFTLTEEGLVNPVSLGVWGADQAGLQRWDRIVAVDGVPVSSGRAVVAHALLGEVGRPVVYQVEGLDGSHRFVQLPTRLFQPADLLRSHASQSLLGLVFVLIAVLLYFLRPGTAQAWSFFAFFASVGAAMASVVDLTMLWEHPPIYPFIGPYLGVFGLILVGVITGAYQRPSRALRKARALYGLMWALTGLALLVATGLSLGLWVTFDDMPRYLIVDNLMYAWLAAATVIGLCALIVAYRRTRSVRRRARLRQILWAWPVGAGIPTLNLFLGHVLEMAWVSLLWNWFVVLVPLSTADAIVRHDLLDLTHRARRLIGGVTVAAVMGMGLGFVLWASVKFLNLTDAAGMVALAALLFAVAAPVTHRVQRYVDSLLRSAPYDAGRLLADFTARASTAMHLRDVTSQIQKTLEASVHPASFELYRLDRGEQRLLPEVGHGKVCDVDDALLSLLERTEPALFDEEEPCPEALKGSALAVRLAVANEPVGLLTLADRADRRPYEAGDVAFVSSMAGPLAAALVNTRAYEEIEALNADLEERVALRTRELKETNEELALLNQRKDELVAAVSHDFRSPLAIIRQNVQTMLRDLTSMDEEDLRHFLEGIARQEDRLTSMCTNLLDLARLKHTRAPDEEVDVFAVIESVVHGLEVRAEQAGVKLALEVDEEAPTKVRGDFARLSQALTNLVDNAIKFTPGGGRVTVRLLLEEGERLRIEVEDTGLGIPKDAQDRIFEPFFQVLSQAHAGKGSGLGLAIAKAVIDAHGGEIYVESEEGEGTRFVIFLSCAERRARMAAPMLSADGVSSAS